MEDYWRLTGAAWREANASEGYRNLEKILCGLTDLELVQFNFFLNKLRGRLESPAHICALFLINDGAASSDSFLDYTAYISSFPESAYRVITSCPDSFLDFTEMVSFDQIERPFSTITISIYKRRHGLDSERLKQVFDTGFPPLDVNNVSYRNARGFRLVTHEVCRELVPRLYDKFGASAF